MSKTLKDPYAHILPTKMFTTTIENAINSLPPLNSTTFKLTCVPLKVDLLDLEIACIAWNFGKAHSAQSHEAVRTVINALLPDEILDTEIPESVRAHTELHYRVFQYPWRIGYEVLHLDD